MLLIEWVSSDGIFELMTEFNLQDLASRDYLLASLVSSEL